MVLGMTYNLAADVEVLLQTAAHYVGVWPELQGILQDWLQVQQLSLGVLLIHAYTQLLRPA